MVQIEVDNSEYINVAPQADIYKEFEETRNIIKQLQTEGKTIKSFSFQRIINTDTQSKREKIKELSLPENLSFWTEPLDRKHEKQRVWFKSDSLDIIFMNYTMLLERLLEE